MSIENPPIPVARCPNYTTAILVMQCLDGECSSSRPSRAPSVFASNCQWNQNLIGGHILRTDMYHLSISWTALIIRTQKCDRTYMYNTYMKTGASIKDRWFKRILTMTQHFLMVCSHVSSSDREWAAKPIAQATPRRHQWFI